MIWRSRRLKSDCSSGPMRGSPGGGKLGFAGGEGLPASRGLLEIQQRAGILAGDGAGVNVLVCGRCKSLDNDRLEDSARAAGPARALSLAPEVPVPPPKQPGGGTSSLRS